MTIIFKFKEVLQELDLKDSVLKKYIGLLEKEGYVIQKNEQGHRLFYEQDIKILENFIELSKYDGMTLEKVAKEIGQRFGHTVTIDTPSNQYDVMTLTKKLLEEQQKQTRYLLEIQEKRFLETIEKNEKIRINDRDKLLMESIRGRQETKKENLEIIKMLEELKNQVAATQQHKKWWQFWK